MSKGRRDPRDMGDATRQRIDDLAEGWSVKDGEDAEQASPRAKPVSAPPPPRAKRPSAPPPPPRAKRTSAPPPPPRPKRASAPPPAPRAKRASAAPPQPPEIDTVPTPKHDLVIGSADVPDDATVLQTPESMSFVVNEGQAGQVRQRPSLPRKRGIFGDIRYVFTAMFGIAGARRELAEVNAKLDRERDGRDDRLLQSMRDMIADPDVDTPLMERAREQLSTIEDQRSRKAGAAAAAEAEMESLSRARTAEAQENLAVIKQREDECKQIADKLAPLEKAANTARKKANRLHVTLEDIDRKIAETKASLVTVKGPKLDPAAVEADIASLRAERADIAREEPAIAAELDEFEPKIASLKVARTEAKDEIDRLNAAEAQATIRTEEKLTAVRARKAVEDRAVSEANQKRDEALRAVGEQLCIERPGEISVRLRPIDEHDMAIATLERKSLELKELVGGVDRAAITRGVVVMLAGLGMLVGLFWLVVS